MGVRIMVVIPQNLGFSTHPKNPSTTVSCDGVNCHPIEDRLRRHLRQGPPPKGVFQVRSIDGVSEIWHELMGQ